MWITFWILSNVLCAFCIWKQYLHYFKPKVLFTHCWLHWARKTICQYNIIEKKFVFLLSTQTGNYKTSCTSFHLKCHSPSLSGASWNRHAHHSDMQDDCNPTSGTDASRDSWLVRRAAHLPGLRKYRQGVLLHNSL